MPDTAAKEADGGHGLKTSLMSGFENGFGKFPKRSLGFLLCTHLQPCIQMDTDPDDHGEEGVVLPGVDAHIMKVVII